MTAHTHGQPASLPFCWLADDPGPRETEWIVRGLVAKRAVTLLHGSPKAGKSTLLLAMLASVERGEAFVGLDTRATSAVILTEERSPTLRAKTSKFGLERGRVLYRHDARGRSLESIVTLAVADAHANACDILVVDTFAAWSGLYGEQENHSGAITAALAPLLNAAGQGLAVVLIHHSSKAGKTGVGAVRGSSAIAGAVEIIVDLRRHDGNRRSLWIESRFEDSPDSITVSLDQTRYSSHGSAHEAVSGVNQVRILAVVAEHGPSTADEIAFRAGTGKTQVRALLERLAREGEIQRSGTGHKGSPYRYTSLDSFQPGEHTHPGAERNETCADTLRSRDHRTTEHAE